MLWLLVMRIRLGLSLLAVTILFGGLLFLQALPVEAAARSLYLSPSSSSTIKGQGTQITLSIRADSGSEAINAVQSDLNYPSTQLSVVSVTVASGWSQAQNDTSTPGTILFAAFPNPPGSSVTGDNVIATVVFQTSATGVAGVSFAGTSAMTRASDNANILSSTVGATVTSQILAAGQYISSENGLYKLVMQGDGNLVLYGHNLRPMWASGTPSSGANRVVMQGDGNLVLYTASNQPVWASHTPGNGVSNLVLQDDGNLVIYKNSPVSPIWQSLTGGRPSPAYFGSDRLTSGQSLPSGQYLRSTNGKYIVLLQGDGNLVIYTPGYHVLWASHSGGKGATSAVMQGDGNLVLYTSGNAPVWHTATNGNGASYLIMQNDGNFVIYTNAGLPKWQSGTSGGI